MMALIFIIYNVQLGSLINRTKIGIDRFQVACLAGGIVGARNNVLTAEPLKASGEAARNQKVKLNEEEEEEEEEELYLTATPFKRWPHGYFILVHTIAQLVKFFKNPFNMTPLSRLMVFWKF